MEPLSTLVLTAAFLATAPATRRPMWAWEPAPDTRNELSIRSSTQFLLPTPETIATPKTQKALDVPPVKHRAPKNHL